MASWQSVASHGIALDAAVGCWSRRSTAALLQHPTLTPLVRLKQKSLRWGAERSELLGKKFKKFWNQPKWGSPLLEGDLR
jgi:hypothetical protein